MQVAVAGATGFVGRSLCARLATRHPVRALGRRVSDASRVEEASAGLGWRRCDLFSLRQVEEALDGVDLAYYLVHSMMPNARLTQASFEDLDLLLADNFGRAAARAGVGRIVYLGGLVPHEEPENLSQHLRSRLEVERALGAFGVPVTSIRAGLVVGARGSSLEVLVRLVKRLPLMICPAWTRSKTQPIALADVVEILDFCAEAPDTAGRVCEVGGPDVLSYRELMSLTARVLDRRRTMIPVPFVTPALSELWVSLVTGRSRALVAPLVESLQHEMVVRDRWLQDRMGQKGRPLETALRESIRMEGLRVEPVARSVQRMPVPPGRDARWLAEEYLRWLPRFLRPALRVVVEGKQARIHLRGIRKSLLDLMPDEQRSSPDRALFLVTGGLLAAPSEGVARLEFRLVAGGGEAIAAVHDYRPRMPWWLYAATQARGHELVMRAFGRHLGRLAARRESA